MGERLKELRKALGITQQEFADKIGVVRGNIATYETRKSNPGDAVIALICREFNVNETWLRTGEGDMFVTISRDEEIAAFMGDVLKGGRGDFRRRFISVLSRMTPDEWELLERKALELVEEMKSADN